MSPSQTITADILLFFLLVRIQLGFAKIVCKDINDISLKIANEKRKLHEVQALKFNPGLAESSTEYAKELVGKCTMYHAHGDFGENLFISRGSGVGFRDEETDYGANKAWYSEVSCYCGYESHCPPCAYGHFTQLVWDITETQGCGACVDDEKSCLVVVCRYHPPGNLVGAYDQHVKPPYGTQPPIWEVFQKATTKDMAIAGAILASFFGIVVYSFITHLE